MVQAPQHGIQILAAETQATINARNAIELFLATTSRSRPTSNPHP